MFESKRRDNETRMPSPSSIVATQIVTEEECVEGRAAEERKEERAEERKEERRRGKSHRHYLVRAYVERMEEEKREILHVEIVDTLASAVRDISIELGNVQG